MNEERLVKRGWRAEEAGRRKIGRQRQRGQS